MIKRIKKIFRKFIEFLFRGREKKLFSNQKETSLDQSLFIKFDKFLENPIIAPKTENRWETRQAFNPGVILLEDKIHFLYRAIGEDGISRLGYAASYDGVTIYERLPYPVYEHPVNCKTINQVSASGGGIGGCEDARIVRVEEEDVLYMTYTIYDSGLSVGLTSIKVQDFLNKKWEWKFPKSISAPLEIHKNWVIFPEKINGKYAVLHSINPKISIAYVDSLKFKDGEYIHSSYGAEIRENCWDNKLRGAGPPPIKTKHGWLLLYHAIDNSEPWKYKIGAMLLDLKNPAKIINRYKNPILEPDEYYENNGFKGSVVYTPGAVVKNGNLLVYYGGADSCVCVAYANLDNFIESLLWERETKFKSESLKNKL